MNGTKRAAIIHQQDAFIARIVAAIAVLGETMTLVTTPQRGQPFTQFVTADGLGVDFDIFAPNTSDGHWRVTADGVRYDNTCLKLDTVDVEKIAKVLVRPVATKRAEKIAWNIAARLNEDLPRDGSFRVITDHRGGLGLYTSKAFTEAQVVAMIAAARACGIIPS